jgi:hypothetical protein
VKQIQRCGVGQQRTQEAVAGSRREDKAGSSEKLLGFVGEFSPDTAKSQRLVSIVEWWHALDYRDMSKPTSDEILSQCSHAVKYGRSIP